MTKRIRKVWVDGARYPLLREIPGKELMVLTEDGPREAFPKYLGWTLIGFRFNNNYPAVKPAVSSNT